MGLSTGVGHRLVIKKYPGSAAIPVPAKSRLRKIDMIRSDLVWRLWDQNPHLLRHDVETIVHAIFDEITAALARGDRVELRGFGAFSFKVREPRTGRNPMTGVLVPVPKRAHPYFKTGKEMNARLNRGKE
jgi:integration host factor subunit beta